MARGLLALTLLTLVALTTVSIPAPSGLTVERYLALRDVVDASGPLPAGVVSNGAEPDIHVTKSGVILIGDHTGLYRSLNGGASWAEAPDPFLPGIFGDGWPIAEDDAGRVYVAETQGQVVGVASSANGGQSWDIVSEVVAVGTIVDRPWLAARGDGEVALVVNSDRGEECYRSTDGGATWLSMNVVPQMNAPNPGSLSFDSRGRLWFSNGATWFRWASPCFSSPSAIDHPNGGAQILTQTDVDSSDRPYTALPSGDNGQMILHSTSVGVQKALVVSPPAQRSNTFGAIDVDNATGDIVVGWYGSTTPGNPSSSSFSGSWHVFVARVSNFWSASPTITLTQVTPANTPNHVGGFCMSGIGCSTGGADRDLLDYFGVAFGPDGTIHVAYGHDGATSNADVRYAHVV